MSDEGNTKIHPSILHYEKTGSKVVELAGYLGSEQEGRIRLYDTLEGTTYVEIMKDDIVNMAREEGKEGWVKISVPHDLQVAMISRAVTPAGGASAFLGGLGARQFGVQSVWTCVNTFIGDIGPANAERLKGY
jgi:hypothetical protein